MLRSPKLHNNESEIALLLIKISRIKHEERFSYAEKANNHRQKKSRHELFSISAAFSVPLTEQEQQHSLIILLYMLFLL